MNVAYWLYLSVLLFAPLAFGTTELWSLVTVEVLAGIAAVILFISGWIRREGLYEVPGAAPLLLLLVFMAVQLAPLPSGLVKVIAPASYEAYAPLFAVGGDQWIPLTIHQRGTLQELLRIGSYALFYCVTVQLLSSHTLLKRTLSAVIWLAATIAFLAIIHQVSSPDTLFWLRPAPDGTSPFGPWVNPNQYAGFMEMLSPLAIALFLFYKPRVERSESLRERIVAFFTMSGANQHLLYGLAAVVVTMSVFVSLCRGGILTISVAVLIFMLLYNLKRPRQGRGAVAVITCCILVTVSWFGWDTVIAEFDRGVNAAGELRDGRFDIWTDVVRIIAAFCGFGSGFGTFVDIYPSYTTIPAEVIFDHAHNDYLELLTDGGIIGFGLAGWFVVAVIRHGWGRIRARRDQYAALLGIGALTGILAMLLHSITDFNMHNGADGLYFFFLCGLLVAAANVRFSAFEAKSLLKQQNIKRNPAVAAVAAVFLVTVTMVQYRTVLAGVAYDRVKNLYISKNLSEDRRNDLITGLSRAEHLDPLEQIYAYKRALLHWYNGDREAARRKYLQAARKNPMTGASLQWLGLLAEDAAVSKMLVEKGYQRALNKDEQALTFVEYLLWRDDREKAISVMAERIAHKNNLIRKWIPMLQSFSFTPDEIHALLPDAPDAWIMYGDYLQQLGDNAGSEYYRTTALTFIGNPEDLNPQWFQQLIQFYSTTDQADKALAVLREAAEKLPDHASFHLQLGDYYRSRHINFLAKEEYERALIIHPGNTAARSGLRKMGMLDAY